MLTFWLRKAKSNRTKSTEEVQCYHPDKKSQAGTKLGDDKKRQEYSRDEISESMGQLMSELKLWEEVKTEEDTDNN